MEIKERMDEELKTNALKVSALEAILLFLPHYIKMGDEKKQIEEATAHVADLREAVISMISIIAAQEAELKRINSKDPLGLFE